MPPKEKKERSTNFRTWETQSRLLAALVASLDGARLDYKSKCIFCGLATSFFCFRSFRPRPGGQHSLDHIYVLDHGGPAGAARETAMKSAEPLEADCGPVPTLQKSPSATVVRPPSRPLSIGSGTSRPRPTSSGASSRPGRTPSSTTSTRSRRRRVSLAAALSQSFRSRRRRHRPRHRRCREEGLARLRTPSFVQ